MSSSIIDSIFPDSSFELGGLLVTLLGLGVIGVLIAIYFVFLKDKDTGDNRAEEV